MEGPKAQGPTDRQRGIQSAPREIMGCPVRRDELYLLLAFEDFRDLLRPGVPTYDTPALGRGWNNMSRLVWVVGLRSDTKHVYSAHVSSKSITSSRLKASCLRYARSESGADRRLEAMDEATSGRVTKALKGVC
jgi:hypothetical protein